MKANDSYPEQSQRKLAAGVLEQAAQDLRRFHNATSKLGRELYLDAYRWAMFDDYSWPFSFPNVCQILNRKLEELRQELIGDLAFAPSVESTRNRAARLNFSEILSFPLGK